MADYTAASAAYADVATQLALAGPGDRVLVPAGTASWATAFNVAANVTLEGAGVDTIISTTSNTLTGTIQLFSGATVKNFRIIGNAYSPFGAATGAKGWRITGITYTASGSSRFLNIASPGATWGLIDNCIIAGAAGTSELIYTKGPSDAWETPSTFGTDQAIYIEDCTFPGTGYVSDFNSNAKGVVRFCTITGGLKVDLHGVASNSPARGGRHMEVYHCAWSAVGFYTAVEHRGGGLIAFNNTNSATNTNHGVFRLHEYGLNSQQWGNFPTNQTLNDYPIRDQVGRGMYSTPGDPTTAQLEPCYLWGNRRGSNQWTPFFASVADTTRATNSASYSAGATQITFAGTAKIGVGTSFRIPGFTQRYVVTVGRLEGSSAAVTFTPPLVDAFTGPVSIAIGSLQNYKYQQGDESATFTVQQVIAADRDYFNEVSSFNGSSGVGIGTRAQMDAITPTLPGVGFWATDEGNWNTTVDPATSGQLYTWTGSEWQLKYVPYTYPHPLRGALAAPTFTLQPANRTTEEGLPTVFTCAASANPSPTYQWFFNGVAISGATSATYTIAVTQLTNAGTYHCVATNSQGSTPSDSATLTVGEVTPGTPPAFTVQPVSADVLETDDISFTVDATGEPTPTYQWYKGGVILTESARLVGVTAKTFTILGVSEADEGIYTCVATSTAGTATSNGAGLTVSQPSAASSAGNPFGDKGTRASLIFALP